MTSCAVCGRDIVRTLTAGLEGWGHTTNPGPDHHYARPVESPKSSVEARQPGVRVAQRTSPAARRGIAESATR